MLCEKLLLLVVVVDFFDKAQIMTVSIGRPGERSVEAIITDGSTTQERFRRLQGQSVGATQLQVRPKPTRFPIQSRPDGRGNPMDGLLRNVS